MKLFDKIYLIGFMGSGKSTTGKQLARYLNWTFIDLDDEIEKKTGMEIREIFSKKGEQAFRHIESDILKATKVVSNAVIATGGGTPCFGENMIFMLDNGLTVYLKLTPGRLKENLAGFTDKRPLLTDIGNISLEDYISEKLAEREKWYSSAKLIVDGNNTDFRRLSILVGNRII